jgi:arginine exporter protein ArgO
LASVSSLGRNLSADKLRLQTAFVMCLDFMAGLPLCFGKFSKNKHQKNSFRRVVTAAETASLISILTLPQVVLQVVGSVVVAGGLETQLSALGNVGRVVCSDADKWVFMTGTGYASFVFLLAVLMAWFSRDLPSAFNEKDQIFNAATIACIVTCMSLGLAEVIDEPTTAPDAMVRRANSSSHLPPTTLFLVSHNLTVSSLFSGDLTSQCLDWHCGECSVAYHLAQD